jgi:hypothetical protein
MLVILTISENKSAVLNKHFPVLYLRDKLGLGHRSKKAYYCRVTSIETIEVINSLWSYLNWHNHFVLLKMGDDGARNM